MKVKQFRYASDNLGYLIYSQTSAVAVDGGAVEAILSFLRDNDLVLKYAANTHSHADHVAGTQALLEATGALYLDNKTLLGKEAFPLDGESIRVYHTPGHTHDSVTFHADDKLVSGDALFNATVGNCFTGDLKSFYDSIKTLLSLPDETIVYAGHDYVEESIAFAKSVDPENRDLDAFAAKYDPKHVWSTLGEERRINPFVRFNEEPIITYLKERGYPVGTEYERWESVMDLD